MKNLNLTKIPNTNSKNLIKKIIESYKHFVNKYHLHNCVMCPILFNNRCINVLSNNERIKKHFICPNDERYLNKGIIFTMCTWINYVYDLDDFYNYFKFDLVDKDSIPFYKENKFKIKYVKKL